MHTPLMKLAYSAFLICTCLTACSNHEPAIETLFKFHPSVDLGNGLSMELPAHAKLQAPSNLYCVNEPKPRICYTELLVISWPESGVGPVEFLSPKIVERVHSCLGNKCDTQHDGYELIDQVRIVKGTTVLATVKVR